MGLVCPQQQVAFPLSKKSRCRLLTKCCFRKLTDGNFLDGIYSTHTIPISCAAYHKKIGWNKSNPGHLGSKARTCPFWGLEERRLHSSFCRLYQGGYEPPHMARAFIIMLTSSCCSGLVCRFDPFLAGANW